MTSTARVYVNVWKRCEFCRETFSFKSPIEFCRHLRDFHCTREGGSFICRYARNGVCPSLPVDGVSDLDYEDHIMRDHVNLNAEGTQGALMRLHSGSLQHASTEPSIVEDQHKWTVYKSNVNLPAVMNDPRLLKRETDFFTKTWGVDFYEKTDFSSSQYLPEISHAHFGSYVKRTSERYKKHSKQLLSLMEEKPSDSYLTKTVKQAERNRTELEQIPKLFMLPNFNPENPDTFNAVFPWTQVEESKLFLLPNFNLENPDTFNAVFPWTQVEESKVTQPGTTRQSSKLLQEKLSHYLDIVEVQIAQQISRRSEAFFHAMTSHDELQDKMKVTCSRIKFLRGKINSMDAMMARESLKVLKLTKTRAAYVQLHYKLKLMATVHQTQPTIQTLLSTNEFVGALDLIATTQEVLSQELAGVHSLRHLGSQLAEMEKLIDIMIQEEFQKHVTAELNRPAIDDIPLLDEEKLVAILFGMIRQQKFQFLDMYKDETFTGMKAVVKQTVIEAVTAADDIDVEDNNISLADQMRLLNYVQWMGLMKKIFHNLKVLLLRAKAFHDIVKDVVGIAAGRTKLPSPLPSPTEDDPDHPLEEPKHLSVTVSEDVDVMIGEEEYNKATGGLRELLVSVCDHAHDRCVKVVQARAKDGFLERLSSAEFVALSRDIEKFVSDCEEITGRRSMSLRGSLQSQANRFINRFHEERRTKLSLILDNERWKQADVPTDFQDLVNHISQTGHLSIPDVKGDQEKCPGEFLIVDGKNFAVVGTVLLLLKMIVEYCQCMEDIPSVAADLLTRLVDLLKIFNSRTCQLVLGAGALELVGLKTISTRNLGLASRCLQLVVFYMPLVRKHFEEKLVSRNISMLKHFDQILKDYQDHIDEISNKLVTIMESMIDSQLSRWEVKAPMPSPCFRAICKQMAKLHEAIVDILPQQQVRGIFTRVNVTFKSVLRKQLVLLNVTNNGGPQHGLVTSDLTFYAGSFKTLRGLEDLAQDVNDVWDKR